MNETHQKLRDFVEYLNSLDLNQSDLYEQYMAMKNAQKVLDERIEEIQGLITSEMESLGVQKQTFPYGTFSLTERKTWKYTEAIEKLSETLKTAKKSQEESGEANFEIKKSLTFRS